MEAHHYRISLFEHYVFGKPISNFQARTLRATDSLLCNLFIASAILFFLAMPRG